MIDLRMTRRAAFLTAACVVAPATGSVAAQAPVWRNIEWSGAGPAPRWDHHLTVDPESQTLLVFGGRDEAGNAFDDTWLFDLGSATWSQVGGAGPSARFGSATASQVDGRSVFLFGGQAGSDFYNDTWRFDFTSQAWQLLDDGASTAPTPRYGLGGAFDDAGNLFISHGFTFDGRFDDSWTFEPESAIWTDRTPGGVRPLNRCLHEMAAVRGTSAILLYGGCSSGYGPCPQGDTWSYDSVTGLWTELTPAASPPARSNPSLVWSEGSSGALLFAGQTELGKSSDLWAGSWQDGQFTWSEITPAGDWPVPRSSHDAVDLGSVMYLFGGLGDSGALNDLWILEI